MFACIHLIELLTGVAFESSVFVDSSQINRGYEDALLFFFNYILATHNGYAKSLTVNQT